MPFLALPCEPFLVHHVVAMATRNARTELDTEYYSHLHHTLWGEYQELHRINQVYTMLAIIVAQSHCGPVYTLKQGLLLTSAHIMDRIVTEDAAGRRQRSMVVIAASCHYLFSCSALCCQSICDGTPLTIGFPCTNVLYACVDGTCWKGKNY